MELQAMNKQRLDDIKYMGMSHGLEMLISQIKKAQKFNSKQTQTRQDRIRGEVNVYFSWVTDNRLMAHIIVDNELLRLVIPEAGHRLYANYKDGYQVNGGGYNKPDHILDAMVYQVKKHINASIEINVRASLIS